MEKLPVNTRPAGLTVHQEAFALEFVRTRNQRLAYRHAYPEQNISSVTLGKRAFDTYEHPGVNARIKELIDAAAAPTVASVAWVLDRLTKIARADPNELISAKVGACRYCYGEGHGYQWKVREYDEAMARADTLNEQAVLNNRPANHPYPDPGGGFGFDQTRPPHPDCPECKGEGELRIVPKDTEELSPDARALFAGVEQTTTGVKIKMHDQTRALELAGKIIGAFKDDSPKTLQVELRGVMAQVPIEAKDPQEAARMYQDMIAGRTAK
jgi:phage terminase small subunit